MKWLVKLFLAVLLLSPFRLKAQELVFADAIPRQWTLMYREFKTEFLQCVYVTALPPDTVFVFNAINVNMPPSQSRQYRAGASPSDSLRLEPCPWHGPTVELVGLAHQHKNAPNPCSMSNQDQVALFESRDDRLAFIICGDHRFAVYSRNTYKERRLLCEYNPEAFDIALTCKLEQFSKR